MTFIESHFDLNWNTPDLCCIACHFEQDEYSDELFKDFQISWDEKLKKAVTKRKAEYLAGRYLAKLALLERGYKQTEVNAGPKREPLWPTGISGSISHCDDYAVCVLGSSALYRGLGIDVESIISVARMQNIQSQILTPAEITRLSAWPFTIEEAITLAFSLKESFFKAAFPLVQRYFGFDAIEVIQLAPETKTIEFALRNSLHPDLQCDTRMSGYYQFPEPGKVVTLMAL